LTATLSVGWLTKQASAARPKWRSRATATMYFSSVSVMARILPPPPGALPRSGDQLQADSGSRGAGRSGGGLASPAKRGGAVRVPPEKLEPREPLMNPSTPGASAGPSSTPVAVTDAQGYFGSSLDLRAGLEVREFSEALVPGEMRREFMRRAESFRGRSGSGSAG
jgi:hypothetical protein